MRIRLKPGLRRVWRGPEALQIGLSRRCGTVVRGLTPQDVPLVEALRHGLDVSAPGDLAAYGDPERGQALVRVLGESGVLVSSGPGTADPGRLGQAAARLAPDAAVWSAVYPRSEDGWPVLLARAARLVVVHGAGRLGTALCATLAAAGTGTVIVRDGSRVTAADLSPAGAGMPDLGRLRQAVGEDVVRRAGGHPRPASTAGRPDLVVLIQHGTADATLADSLMSADVPHLAVVVGEDGVVVGPLVRPGLSACLRCLDLHRQDRDPDWASVLAQLRSPRGGHSPVDPPEETASAGLAAGLAALQVLAQLDGLSRPAAVGATLELELPDGLVARRPWPMHPSCGCS